MGSREGFYTESSSRIWKDAGRDLAGVDFTWHPHHLNYLLHFSCYYFHLGWCATFSTVTSSSCPVPNIKGTATDERTWPPSSLNQGPFKDGYRNVAKKFVCFCRYPKHWFYRFLPPKFLRENWVAGSSNRMFLWDSAEVSILLLLITDDGKFKPAFVPALTIWLNFIFLGSFQA